MMVTTAHTTLMAGIFPWAVVDLKLLSTLQWVLENTHSCPAKLTEYYRSRILRTVLLIAY